MTTKKIVKVEKSVKMYIFSFIICLIIFSLKKMDVIIDQMFDVSSDVVRIKKFISSGKRIETFSTDTEIVKLRPCPEKIEEVVNSGVSDAKCRPKLSISHTNIRLFFVLLINFKKS